MKILLIDMLLILTLGLTFLDFAISDKTRERFRIWLFDRWYWIASRSYRRLVVNMLNRFDSSINYVFGRKLFSSQAILRTIQIHAKLFLVLMLSAFWENYSGIYITSDWSKWHLSRLAHIEHYFNRMNEASSESSSETYMRWLLQVKHLNAGEYRNANFANNTFKAMYIGCYAFIVSTILAFTSLLTTRFFIRSIRRRAISMHICADVMIALVLSFASFLLIVYFRLGAGLSGELYFHLYDRYLSLFGQLRT